MGGGSARAHHPNKRGESTPSPDLTCYTTTPASKVHIFKANRIPLGILPQSHAMSIIESFHAWATSTPYRGTLQISWGHLWTPPTSSPFFLTPVLGHHSTPVRVLFSISQLFHETASSGPGEEGRLELPYSLNPRPSAPKPVLSVDILYKAGEQMKGPLTHEELNAFKMCNAANSVR